MADATLRVRLQGPRRLGGTSSPRRVRQAPARLRERRTAERNPKPRARLIFRKNWRSVARASPPLGVFYLDFRCDSLGRRFPVSAKCDSRGLTAYRGALQYSGAFKITLGGAVYVLRRFARNRCGKMVLGKEMHG